MSTDKTFDIKTVVIQDNVHTALSMLGSEYAQLWSVCKML